MNIVTFRTDPDTDPPSADTYADIPITAIDVTARVTKLTATTSGPMAVNWKNTGANTIKCKIMGSNNADAVEAERATVEAEFTIAAAAWAHKKADLAYWQFYWFMHAANAGGSQGASRIFGRHSRI